jgi:hypothetical protein
MIKPKFLPVHLQTPMTMTNKETSMVKLNGELFPTLTYIVCKTSLLIEQNPRNPTKIKILRRKIELNPHLLPYPT